MLLDDAVRARRRIVCDELGLGFPPDESVLGFVDEMGALWVPVPGRPGWVRRGAVVPFSSAYVDALRRALRRVPAGSPVWYELPLGVFDLVYGGDCRD